jgi:hypothetical protein
LLLMFLLKGAMPDRYRERSTIDVNQSVTIDLRKLPREELLRRLEQLRLEQRTVAGNVVAISEDGAS